MRILGGTHITVALSGTSTRDDDVSADNGVIPYMDFARHVGLRRYHHVTAERGIVRVRWLALSARIPLSDRDVMVECPIVANANLSTDDKS